MCWCTGFAARSIRKSRSFTRFEESVMSFAQLEIFRRNVGVRLGFWYALIFGISSIALLTVAYYLLAAAISSKDRELVQARLREYAAVYDSGGLAALRSTIQQERENQKTLFVRLVSAWNDITFANVPDEWVTFHDVPNGRAGSRERSEEHT